MQILGIDPGSRYTGYALIEMNGRKIDYINSGVLDFSNEKNFLKRLPIIFEACYQLIDKVSPDEIALESLIYVKNVNSLAKLAQARGAIISALMASQKNNDLNYSELYEYSPNLIKSSVSGYGHASKEQISKALQIIFGKDKIKFIKDDESDALAIALTHSLLRKSNKNT